MDFHDLELELRWFAAVLDARFRQYFAPPEAPAAPPDVSGLTPPAFEGSDSPWARFLGERTLSLAERLAVTLVLASELRPKLLDLFFAKNASFDRRFTEFGGVRVDDEFQPTGETLAFVLGGDTLEAWFDAAGIVDPEHPLLMSEILRCVPTRPEQPRMKAALCFGPGALSRLTTGRHKPPVFGVDFPAQRIDTGLDWPDLVLHPGTLRQIQEIQVYIEHGRTLMTDWGMSKRLRPGYRALFYGPPGTGKTLSAALLGKLTGLDVYRIDLSLVVSKYIGETEKNLARLLDNAQRRRLILFFDECDALFGKRSEIKDSHDLHANQQIAYLLQRIETFDGIVILASNLRGNLDEAFSRRFESVVYFPLPRAEERLTLWQQGFASKAKLDADVDLGALSREHQLSGGAIINVIRYASLAAIADGERALSLTDLHQGVRRELAKEGRQA